MTTTAVDDQFAPEPIQEIEQKHHDKIVGIIAEKIEAERRPAPHGWKLVPVEPTPEMLEAGAKQVDWYAHNALECYHAMLAVAPTPPAQVEPSDEHVSVVGMPEFDALLDHIYEHGTTSEGVRSRADALARALLARYGRQQAESANQVQALREALHAAAEYIGDRSAGSSTFWDLYDAAMAQHQGEKHGNV